MNPENSAAFTAELMRRLSLRRIFGTVAITLGALAGTGPCRCFSPGVELPGGVVVGLKIVRVPVDEQERCWRA